MTIEKTAAATRVEMLLASMTLEEKLAQIVGFWQDEEGVIVAPLQGEASHAGTLADATRDGLGHLTRVYGTSPVDPDARAAWLWREQRRLVTGTRLGIPALVHEEILTGLAAWHAATFPTPLALGATFDPDAVDRMGALIGQSMRDLGIHQGLAPVLDVIRDPRWGRVDECISEDPYLVGTVGTSYVRGVQSAGVHATLKHFLGYSASQSGRNFGPVHAGPREIRDVFVPPFEMAILDGNARSVMNAYTEIDGVPVAASAEVLTGILRDEWGFDGTVVADYFAIAFLQRLHGVAADLTEAGIQALTAGIDIELPSGDAYREPLASAVRAGLIDEALVDRAAERALRQKEELGLLDETFEGEPPTGVVLDGPAHRAVAKELAEKSVVLVSNQGILPLARDTRRIALIGPNADRYRALFGCYSFANHVLDRHPDVALGIEAPTVADAMRLEFAGDVTFAEGCAVDTEDRAGFAAAVDAASAADVAVLVMGDQAGLFGGGTVGEGCDRDDLSLPGVQGELIEAVLATGTPVVLVLVTGRPYAIGPVLDRCAAVVQSFFPGEEGGGAIAGVLSGRVNPSGRMPVSMPRSAGSQPYSYLHPALAGNSEVTNLRSAPAAEFGHGLSYTTFEYSDFSVPAEARTDGWIDATVTVTNTGAREGDEVVQLYAHDVVASVTRPVAQLVGYLRVSLAPGESTQVAFRVPSGRLAFTDRAMRRVVEPGRVDLWCGTPMTRVAEASLQVTGSVHEITVASPRWTAATAT